IPVILIPRQNSSRRIGGEKPFEIIRRDEVQPIASIRGNQLRATPCKWPGREFGVNIEATRKWVGWSKREDLAVFKVLAKIGAGGARACQVPISHCPGSINITVILDTK